jgi:hypothetical protein
MTTELCAVTDCTNPVRTALLCNGHYKRARRGDYSTAPIARRRNRLSAMERIQDQSIVADGDCWVFTGATTRGGYGELTVDGVHLLAHRVALTDAVGPPPEGRSHALHSCDNPPCVNPAHLRWGNDAENVADMRSRGRMPVGDAIPTSVLNESDVRAIRSDPRSCRIIAQDYRVSLAQVSRIKRRERWGWLPDEDVEGIAS